MEIVESGNKNTFFKLYEGVNKIKRLTKIMLAGALTAMLSGMLATAYITAEQKSIDVNAVCSCVLTMGLTYPQAANIPATTTSYNLPLTATASLTGNCQLPGHSTAAISYRYEVISDTNHIVGGMSGLTIQLKDIPYFLSDIRLNVIAYTDYVESAPREVKFSIFRRPPAPVITTSNGYVLGDWTNRDVALSFSVVPSTIPKYRVNGGSWIEAGSVTFTDAGIYTVEAQAVNGGGQFAATARAVVKIDKTNPNVAVSTQ